MRSYLYYPGCSLTGTAKEYDLSVRALAEGLGMDLLEIRDWTCCGATAAQAVDTGLATALSARNLALAAKTIMQSPSEGAGSPREKKAPDLLVPCSACYLNLKTAGIQIQEDKAVRAFADRVLAQEGLDVPAGIRVRHLLDVLSNDVDWGAQGSQAAAGGCSGSNLLPVPKITVPMDGVVVAPYYGCQCLRPFRVFDDPEAPRSMEAMIRATGARVLDWEMGSECCGASHGTTKPAAGSALTQRILSAARKAHCIVTVCPMCQMNLEMFQDRDQPVPVLYLPQFLGMAMGLPGRALGLALNLTDCRALQGGG